MDGLSFNKKPGLFRQTVTLDFASKPVILALEKAVKKETGLDWRVTEAGNGRTLLLWELLLPIRGGKIHITGQSNDDNPLEIYGFSISEADLFMKALKQIEQKR